MEDSNVVTDLIALKFEAVWTSFTEVQEHQNIDSNRYSHLQRNTGLGQTDCCRYDESSKNGNVGTQEG